MKFLDFIDNFTAHPYVRKIARSLGISELGKKLLFLALKPKNGIFCVNFQKIEACFILKDYSTLRYLKSHWGERIEKDYDERIFIDVLLNMLHPGDVAYDIGAAIGAHTIFLAKKVGENGKVVSFEPNVETYKSLLSNIKLNKLSNVIPLQIALGNNIGEGIMTGDWNQSRLVQGIEESGTCRASIMPGDVLVQTHNLPIPKAVKIDAEGYEYNVISGLKETLKQNQCKLVCCEIHPTLLPSDIKPEMVLSLLRELSFYNIKEYVRGNTIHAICSKD